MPSRAVTRRRVGGSGTTVEETSEVNNLRRVIVTTYEIPLVVTILRSTVFILYRHGCCEENQTDSLVLLLSGWDTTNRKESVGLICDWVIVPMRSKFIYLYTYRFWNYNLRTQKSLS